MRSTFVLSAKAAGKTVVSTTTHYNVVLNGLDELTQRVPVKQPTPLAPSRESARFFQWLNAPRS